MTFHIGEISRWSETGIQGRPTGDLPEFKSGRLLILSASLMRLTSSGQGFIPENKLLTSCLFDCL